MLGPVVVSFVNWLKLSLESYWSHKKKKFNIFFYPNPCGVLLDMYALYMCHVSNLTKFLTESHDIDQFDVRIVTLRIMSQKIIKP